MLRIKHSLRRPISKFFERGTLIATFDGGPCYLVFSDGKIFFYEQWGVSEVDDRTYSKRTEKTAVIKDPDLKISNDQDFTYVFMTDSGEYAYFKDGNITSVAHSETRPNSNYRIIICNSGTYKIKYKRRFWFWLSTVEENGEYIGDIVESRMIPFYPTRSNLPKRIPLLERVFITLLAFDWPEHAISKVR